jgi:tetratricopeptide (TPR) repeat protein
MSSFSEIDDTTTPYSESQDLRILPTRKRAAPWTLSVGDEFKKGKFIKKKITGGMADIYVIQDSDSKRTFALKTFRVDVVKDVHPFAEEFLQEIKRWVSLKKHTNIVHAYSVDFFKRRPAIWLDYIDGGDISQYIGCLSIPKILDFAIQFCNGMDYAFKKTGIIHNDIKPSNILISVDGILKITDFGTSQVAPLDIEEQSYQEIETPQSLRWLTRRYAAPEAFPTRTKEKYDYCFQEMKITTHSDIYSFGVTLYQILTGELPFQSIDKLFQGTTYNPKALRPDIPTNLDLLVMRCLEKDPTKRYRDFEEVMQMLIEIYDALPSEQRSFGDKYTVKGKEEQQDEVAYYSLGAILVSLDKDEEAKASLDRALDINPKNADTWYVKGISHMYLGEHSDAQECFKQALALKPEFAYAWFGKGQHYLFYLGAYEEAKECFSRVLEIKPRYADAWYCRGICHISLGEYRIARNQFEQALKIKPRHGGAWYGKGLSHAYLEEWGEAIECFKEALRIYPRYREALYNKGVCHNSLGEYSAGLECFGRILSIDPEDPQAWFSTGVSNWYLAEYEEAKHSFEKFISLATPEMTDYVKTAEAYIKQLSASL